MTKKTLHILACDAFSYELEALRKKFSLEDIFKCKIDITYLTQKLHVDFSKLETAVCLTLNTIQADAIILLYGSKCHPNFESILPAKKIFLLEENNCMHAITGKDTQDCPRTFFLNPLQVKNWRKFFAYDIKNDDEKVVFKENFCKYCDNATFFDTQVCNISKEQLHFFEQATGLPVKTNVIGLEPFQKTFFATIEKALAK